MGTVCIKVLLHLCSSKCGPAESSYSNKVMDKAGNMAVSLVMTVLFYLISAQIFVALPQTLMLTTI